MSLPVSISITTISFSTSAATKYLPLDGVLLDAILVLAAIVAWSLLMLAESLLATVVGCSWLAVSLSLALSSVLLVAIDTSVAFTACNLACLSACSDSCVEIDFDCCKLITIGFCSVSFVVGLISCFSVRISLSSCS